MGSLLPIALNTFREARRNRIFYSILFFAVALILFSVLFTEVTFVSQDRILRDVGFGAIDFFAVGLAIFLGIGMVNKEIERRTIFTVISKPVPRWAFILGKAMLGPDIVEQGRAHRAVLFWTARVRCRQFFRPAWHCRDSNLRHRMFLRNCTSAISLMKPYSGSTRGCSDSVHFGLGPVPNLATIGIS